MIPETSDSEVKAMRNQVKPRRRVCPHCGSWEIHSTRWKGLVERCVLYLWGLAPYQCKGCYRRFYARPTPPLGTVTGTVSVYPSRNMPKRDQKGAALREKVQ